MSGAEDTPTEGPSMSPLAVVHEDVGVDCIPEAVCLFVKELHVALQEQDVASVHVLYENTFNKLTETYYKSDKWPKWEQVSDQLAIDDQVFGILYKEMYYRHIYAKLSPTFENRVMSFQNYWDLFDFFLNHDSTDAQLDLPNQWIWDIVDEFVYQYQTYCQFRTKLRHQKGKEDEIELVKGNPTIWNTVYVLNTLNRLADKSDIKNELQRKGDKSMEILEPGPNHLMLMLGYFAIMNQLRVHSLLGDYHTALRSIDCVDFSSPQKIFTKIHACHISLYYYVGFAHMMLRRYADAVKFFVQILIYVQRIKNIHTRSYQYSVIMKKNDQIYYLLQLCLVLCPMRIDESLSTMMKDKIPTDNLNRLAQGEDSVFREMFAWSCPKFISPSLPDFDTPPSEKKEGALELQRRMFLREVQQQKVLPTIRSYLQLYSSISMGKLASFMSEPGSVPQRPVGEDTFREHLLCLKHKSRQLTWQKGPVSNGQHASVSDIDFFIDLGMVHVGSAAVVQGRSTRSYADYFIRQIATLDPLLVQLSQQIDH